MHLFLFITARYSVDSLFDRILLGERYEMEALDSAETLAVRVFLDYGSILFDACKGSLAPLSVQVFGLIL